MITLRPSNERGYADHGWLQSHHTFSFANYHDPAHMRFHALRVINEDFIAAGQGFGTHGHENMEIISYVVAGALTHRDSMGNGSTITQGEVQYMSAGTGVTHSEFNHSKNDTTHLLQIWIFPHEKNQSPRYDQKNFSREAKRNQLLLIASESGQEGSIAIRQNARVYASCLDKDNAVSLELSSRPYAWLQIVTGDLTVNEAAATAGDGLAISEESLLNIKATTDAEFLLFELS